MEEKIFKVNYKLNNYFYKSNVKACCLLEAMLAVLSRFDYSNKVDIVSVEDLEQEEKSL